MSFVKTELKTVPDFGHKQFGIDRLSLTVEDLGAGDVRIMTGAPGYVRSQLCHSKDLIEIGQALIDLGRCMNPDL